MLLMSNIISYTCLALTPHAIRTIYANIFQQAPFLTNAIIYKQKAPDANIGCLKFHR